MNAKGSFEERRPSTRVKCPCCGEIHQLAVDRVSGKEQTYIEDGAMGCRPCVVHVEPADEPGEINVGLERGE